MLQEVLQQVTNGLVLGSTYALIALGLTVIYGILGIVNWAHGELYMLGAFAGLFLVVNWHWPFLAGLVGAMAIMALFGVVMERLVFRPLRHAEEMNSIIGTLGISIFLMNAAILIFSPNPMRFPTEYSNQYFSLLGISITLQRLLVVVTTVALIALLHYIIQHTTIGKTMRACEQNPTAAKLMGISLSTLQNYEAGKTFPDVPVIKRIEELYDVEYKDIIFIQGFHNAGTNQHPGKYHRT